MSEIVASEMVEIVVSDMAEIVASEMTEIVASGMTEIVVYIPSSMYLANPFLLFQHAQSVTDHDTHYNPLVLCLYLCSSLLL
ncbi:hypothetical protein A2U01_0078947 [Trifolium medium]|uniref:Uncharacterized protein n=1 Tax=Trifolium medium TaxID=97028 RepID=A0A392TC36_9FABA|nr:hypothetical protein [Trifolium medium]